MKKMAFIFVFLCAFSAHADGNYQIGEEKSKVCAACHGPTGISTNPEWPSLAGQHVDYLIKQLNDFKIGKTRHSAVMSPLVANLSEEDMADLAAFYAKQPLPSGETPRNYVENGQQLYRGGDFSKHITACIACHGPRGTGNAEAGFPVLSGQQAIYTMQQLKAFKHKKRSNDLNSIMQDITVRMSDEDIESVAYYVAGLH